MNDLDLEEALRDELQGRAKAIDRDVSLLEPVARRVRRIRRRRIAAASALAVLTGAVVTGAVVSGALATLTTYGPAAAPGDHSALGIDARSANGAAPAQHRSSLPPSGWVPVAHDSVQVFVPAAWLVEAGRGVTCGGGAPGMVFFDQVPGPRAFRAAGCRPAVNVVTLLTSTPLLFGALMPPNRAVNGLLVHVRRGSDGTTVYLAPGLGGGVRASGPLAARVVATLSRSPRSVALAGGPPTPVPKGWRWHDFGGIRFAAPAAWTLERHSWSGGCPDGIAAATVRFSTAATISHPGCGGLPRATAGSQAARPGVVVAAVRHAFFGFGSNGRSDSALAQCPRLRGMPACVLPARSDDTLLQLAVFPSGAVRPTLVEIGLSGTGATARAILDSIRPATHPIAPQGRPPQPPRPPR